MIRNIHGCNRRKQRKAMRSRAWLNGEEVTSRCYYADDRCGVVRLYLEDAEGRKHIDYRTGDAAREERHGKVRIERAINFSSCGTSSIRAGRMCSMVRSVGGPPPVSGTIDGTARCRAC